MQEVEHQLGHVTLACILTNTAFVTTFHGTYNFKSKFKKFYNSVMLRSKLTIAGSNLFLAILMKNIANI